MLYKQQVLVVDEVLRQVRDCSPVFLFIHSVASSLAQAVQQQYSHIQVSIQVKTYSALRMPIICRNT